MLTFGRIGRRLLGWFLVVALLPLLFVGMQGYQSAREAIELEANLHMETVAATKVSQITQWFDERLADMRLLSANPHLKKAVAELSRDYNSDLVDEIIAELEVYKSQSAAYDYLCLYNGDGSPFCCTQVGGEFIPDFEESEIYRRARVTDGPVMSEIHLHPRIGPVVQIAGRFADADSVHGILVATLTLAQTLNPIILDSTGLGNSGEAYLIDADSVMLTPSRFMNHPAPLTHKMDSEGIRMALNGSNGSGVYEGWYGEPVLGSWVYMPAQSWALIAEISAEEAFAPLAKLRRSVLIVTVLTLAAILIVVLFVSRSLSSPIRQLAAASQAVSTGDLTQSVSVRLKDELGELAERFNAMVASLKSSREAERESYESLVRAREDLLRAEKLAAVGELAASIVHEVRNPLSSVKMNLQILEGKLPKDSKTGVHVSLAMLQTQRLEKLLSELLAFSRPVKLELSTVNLGDILDEAAETFRSSAEGEHAEVEIDAASREFSVAADRDKLHAVLLNLLLNAGQAMDEPGKIQISAAQTSNDSRRLVRIRITDNGRGIPAEKLAKVFEPFFTTRKEGTGLGLPNAQKLVQAHGGEMTIDSKQGEGTTVELTIPEAS